MDPGHLATRPFRVTSRAALLAGAVALTALALSCAVVVDATQFGIVTAFGRPVAVIDRPGLTMKAPYETGPRIDRSLFVYVARLPSFSPSRRRRSSRRAPSSGGQSIPSTSSKR